MEGPKLVIDVIDNGGQWTHREWRMLRYLGVDTKILPNNTPLSELRKVDGLILSGGAARVGLTGELGNCAVEGCNALTFRSTDYCWRHQDEPPLDSEPDHEQEPNWWEDNQGE